MGDPLSITASVAGLVSLGLQCTEYLYNYYAACRSQHESLARIADRLDTLSESLRFIDSTVRTRTWRPGEQKIVHSIERAVTRSEDIIHLLQDEVDKFKREPADSWRRKAIVVGRRAAYPFTRRTIEGLSNDVDDFRSNLSVALQALQLREHQNTQDDVEEIHNILKNVQAYSISADIRQWLRAPDATTDLNVVSTKRHAGTGQWLVEGSAFTSWLQEDNSFMWLHGFAGCGKSVLCSTAIQHAFRRRQISDKNAIAFFFFAFNDESKQDASGALRALLFQLCGQVPSLENELARLKASNNQGTPSVPTLLECLRQTITQCRQVYILLDALDESPAGSVRDELLSVIKTMRQWQLDRLHLLVTSRDVPDIRDQMSSHGGMQVALKNDSVHQDISRFVEFQVDHDHQLQRWGDHREKIKDYLTQHAGGVFRWVECQLRPLRQCPRSEKHLEKYLRALPQTLDETYERILCNLEFQEEARQILSLLCFASRPLSVDAVIEALAVEIDDLEGFDPRSRLTGGADDLIRVCPELIEISFTHLMYDNHKVNFEGDALLDNNNDMSNSQTVQIAHFSVQEYLTSDRIKRSSAQNFALCKPREHERISRSCFLYFDCDLLPEQAFDQVSHHTFASYAAEFWHYHHRQGEEYTDAQLSHRIAAFLEAPYKRRRWLKLHNPENPHEVSPDRYGKPPPVTGSPSATYYASLLGLDHVLTHVLSASKIDVNARAGNFDYALQAASIRGHEKIVRTLLDVGADVDARGEGNCIALQRASIGGHAKIVQILLDAGADVNIMGEDTDTALHVASRNGDVKIVQLLLDAGVHIDTKGEDDETALMAATMYSRKEVMLMLLHKGADFNAQSEFLGNALQLATNVGFKEGVEALQAWGAGGRLNGSFAPGLSLRRREDRMDVTEPSPVDDQSQSSSLMARRVKPSRRLLSSAPTSTGQIPLR